MAHGGFYDHHSEYQMRGALSHAELVRAAADRIAPDAARVAVVMADYGCAQGRVSNALIRVALERLRGAHPEVPVFVYHNDLLTNDWPALIEHLRAEDSYLRIEGGPITPLLSAVSFYEPVTPPRIVDLGLSFAAVQWLSGPGPAGCGTALYFDQLEGAPRHAMAAKAHADWTRFLDLRADELAPGGRLVLDMMGVPEDGRAAGHDLWRHMRLICAGLSDEGRIDPDRLDRYVLPVYERSLDEVRRPFEEAVGRRLRLEDVALRAVGNPMADRFREDGDASAFARDFTAFVRAWSEPSLTEALGPTGATVDELYRRLESQLRHDARDFVFEVHAITAVIERRDG
jgi:hypothetical protein